MQYLLLLTVLLYTLYNVQAEKVMRPKMKELNVWSDNSYLTHSVVFDPRDPHINYTVDVLKEIHDVDIHIEGTLVQKLDSHYFASFNTTINLCRILNWRKQSPLGSLVHAYLKDYGNLAESCPIPKGKYFMHKFWIPEDPSMSTLPELDFDVTLMAYHVDADKKRTLMVNDHFVGEAVVQDVNNVKRGILAMLPQAG